MIQLTINGIDLPEVKNGGYSCREETLSESLTMISGRMVEEVRGIVWVIDYSVETMPLSAYQALLNALRSGELTVTFLPDNSQIYQTRQFLCTARPHPVYVMEHLGEAIWKDISFSLREVTPHA